MSADKHEIKVTCEVFCSHDLSTIPSPRTFACHSNRVCPFCSSHTPNPSSPRKRTRILASRGLPGLDCTSPHRVRTHAQTAQPEPQAGEPTSSRPQHCGTLPQQRRTRCKAVFQVKNSPLARANFTHLLTNFSVAARNGAKTMVISIEATIIEAIQLFAAISKSPKSDSPATGKTISESAAKRISVEAGDVTTPRQTATSKEGQPQAAAGIACTSSTSVAAGKTPRVRKLLNARQ